VIHFIGGRSVCVERRFGWNGKAKSKLGLIHCVLLNSAAPWSCLANLPNCTKQGQLFSTFSKMQIKSRHPP
jgi:hypothetical protein